jgi:hypothetical protein
MLSMLVALTKLTESHPVLWLVSIGTPKYVSKLGINEFQKLTCPMKFMKQKSGFGMYLV